MKRIALYIFTLIAFSPVLITHAGASDSAVVHFEILGSQSFSLRSTPVQLSNPREVDLEQGSLDFERATVLTTSANDSWVIQLRTSSTYMGASHDSGYQKPISDFQYRGAGDSFTRVTQSERVISSGSAGGYEIPVDYRVLFDQDTHRDGQYSISLIYTITTQ